ncbi:MAG: sigma-54-dependent Fis family transcriptional regulator [Candidatus Marinimicrobia bacterium]|jgi:two-component system nitrogen regulation response regulator GlnG|nr:sigma-54-dependent Fis family transcriptional regulator [Candidatus Neomarinimicrobiota bacterium]
MIKILVVDDEVKVCEFLVRIMVAYGYDAITSNHGKDALAKVWKEDPDIVLLDIKMPGMNGIDVLKCLKKSDPLLPVIIVTANDDIDTAVQAIKIGAYDYVTKPLNAEKIKIVIENAHEERCLQREVHSLRSELYSKMSLCELMGSSDITKKICRQISIVAPTDFTVVIQGETGTGKELVARSIYDQSNRKDGKLVMVDLNTIPETLIESELFGYEKGSFTGADKSKEGFFEKASNGTLFLDEIGNLPLHLQNKLLRSIEQRQIRRIGGEEDISINIRIIAASSKRLEDLVSSGEFRADIYYRLKEYTIELSPLRERKDDLLFLANLFLNETKLELKKEIAGISESATEKLLGHKWPGNVRELRNVIRKAVLTCSDSTVIEEVDILIDEIDKSVSNDGSGNRLAVDSYTLGETMPPSNVEIDNFEGLSLKDFTKKSISRIEKDVISNVLKHTGGNKSKTARILKIDNSTLYYKIKEYGII